MCIRLVPTTKRTGVKSCFPQRPLPCEHCRQFSRRALSGRSCFYITREDEVKCLTVSEHDGGPAVAHAYQVLSCYRVSSRARQVVIRQFIKPLLPSTEDLKVLRTQSEWKSEIVGVVPTLPTCKRQPGAVNLIVKFNAIQIVVDSESS